MKRLASTRLVNVVIAAGIIMDHELERVFDEVHWSWIDVGA
jgi:hypothetical protein